jgi:muramoyltetrapeptide carboxypeptidase
MVCHNLGTPGWELRKGDILCLEEIGEPLYKVERMLIQLTRAGVFEQVDTVLFGYMSQITGTDEMGGSVETCLRNVLEPFDIGLYFGLPFGHDFPHYPLVLGVEAEIIPDTALAYLNFKLDN